MFLPVAIANAAQSGDVWAANHGLDGDTYQREFDSLSGQGYRLIRLSGYSVHGQDYYASIGTCHQDQRGSARIAYRARTNRRNSIP